MAQRNKSKPVSQNSSLLVLVLFREFVDIQKNIEDYQLCHLIIQCSSCLLLKIVISFKVTIYSLPCEAAGFRRSRENPSSQLIRFCPNNQWFGPISVL